MPSSSPGCCDVSRCVQLGGSRSRSFLTTFSADRRGTEPSPQEGVRNAPGDSRAGSLTPRRRYLLSVPLTAAQKELYASIVKYVNPLGTVAGAELTPPSYSQQEPSRLPSHGQAGTTPHRRSRAQQAPQVNEELQGGDRRRVLCERRGGF